VIATKRVSFDTKLSWELGCESTIFCESIPNPPQSGEETLVKITHSNVYGPIDDVEFYLRVGNPDKPTGFDDLDSAADWVRTELVEEIVMVDDVEMHRSKANEPFGQEEEVPWDGTFEAQIVFPAGKNSIEIKVSSHGMIQSGVISDWVLNVG
jgi:hypothetical protein